MGVIFTPLSPVSWTVVKFRYPRRVNLAHVTNNRKYNKFNQSKWRKGYVEQLFWSNLNIMRVLYIARNKTVFRCDNHIDRIKNILWPFRVKCFQFPCQCLCVCVSHGGRLLRGRWWQYGLPVSRLGINSVIPGNFAVLAAKTPDIRDFRRRKPRCPVIYITHSPHCIILPVISITSQLTQCTKECESQ